MLGTPDIRAGTYWVVTLLGTSSLHLYGLGSPRGGYILGYNPRLLMSLRWSPAYRPLHWLAFCSLPSRGKERQRGLWQILG